MSRIRKPRLMLQRRKPEMEQKPKRKKGLTP